MKTYFAISEYDEVINQADTPEELLQLIKDAGYDEDDLKAFIFYEAVKGTYVPPSTPATLSFPKVR